MTAFLHGFFASHGDHGDPGEKMSINRNHSRTECKNSLEISILRRVFEGDINYDCIFTGFFAGHRGFGSFGGTRGSNPPPLRFKKMNKNPLG